MRFTRARAVLGAVALAAAGTVTGSVLVAGTASAGSSAVVLVNCAGQGQVRPGGYDIGCMANELLAGLHWTSWGPAAFGHGVLKVDDCIPTCAQGKYVRYPVLTVLWRARPWPRHAGREYFSRLTMIFTGARPAHTGPSVTLSLPPT
jgi:hypothetical protein